MTLDWDGDRQQDDTVQVHDTNMRGRFHHTKKEGDVYPAVKMKRKTAGSHVRLKSEGVTVFGRHFQTQGREKNTKQWVENSFLPRQILPIFTAVYHFFNKKKEKDYSVILFIHSFIHSLCSSRGPWSHSVRGRFDVCA